MHQLFNKIILLIAVLVIAESKANAQAANKQLSAEKLCFIENKGQLINQLGEKRTDIQFYAAAGNFKVFVGNGQIHYQMQKTEYPIRNLENTTSLQENTPGDLTADATAPDLATCNIVSRVDVELVNANPDAEVIFDEKQQYYENYYTAGCPLNGIHANTYKKVTYKNVYPDIDWVFYIENNQLEYEFVVGPGGDASGIKLKYSGALSTQLDEHNNVKIVTPLGQVMEGAPVCFHYESSPHSSLSDPVKIGGKYKLDNNMLTFETDEKNSLVIDPRVEWGTYYGEDSSATIFYSLTCDSAAHIYAAGKTYSTSLIASTGSFQNTIGGDMDAFLVKFDSSGNRLWGTYYGSTGGDWATGVQIDNAGHVYMGGCTNSTSGIATPGCQQSVYGGGMFNGFLGMFTTAGIRQWCTYLGGSSATEPASVCTDHLGHVYISGLTNDGTNISTPGSYQSSRGGGHDLFIIQYDSLGARQWGTYYGGPGDEYRGDICSDQYNNIFFCGWTNSTSGIATPSGYQHSLGGGTDAFLAKFNSSGVRQWATYYGGPLGENTGSVGVDNYDYVYLLGGTSSATGIASIGCYQPAIGGGKDAFLAKFDPTAGVMIWATYYGGANDELVDYSKIVSDVSGDIFITGQTASTSGIAGSGVWQSVYGGGSFDCFVAKYNGNGVQLWSSYLGGDDVDQPTAIGFDGDNAYVCGQTQSTNNIATAGGLIPTGGGLTWYNQGFLVKISDYLPTTVEAIPAGKQSISLYPSPNSGRFTVSALSDEKFSGDCKIVVEDLSGNMVYRNHFEATDGRLNQTITLNENLPNGLYFLKWINENGVQVVPFEVQK